MTVEAFVDLIAKGGPTTILLIVIWLLFREELVPGSTHRRVRQERDEYLHLWADAVRLAGRATTVADRAMTRGTSDDRLLAQQRVRAQWTAEEDEPGP